MKAAFLILYAQISFMSLAGLIWLLIQNVDSIPTRLEGACCFAAFMTGASGFAYILSGWLNESSI